MTMLLIADKAGPIFDRPRFAAFREGALLVKIQLRMTLAREAMAACDAPGGCAQCHEDLREVSAEYARFVEGDAYGG